MHLRVGQVGPEFVVEVVNEKGDPVDISGATAPGAKQIRFCAPGGRIIPKDAVFVTDGTDGLMKYVAADGDLKEDGEWCAQGYLDMPGFKGKFGDENEYRFHVKSNFT